MKTLNRAALHLTNSKPIRILQFGGGNFLRGFFNWMVDILNDQAGFEVASSSAVNCHYRDLLVGDLLGHAVEMSYRPPVNGGRMVETSNGEVGLIMDVSPEEQALNRWKAGEFEF